MRKRGQFLKECELIGYDLQALVLLYEEERKKLKPLKGKPPRHASTKRPGHVISEIIRPYRHQGRIFVGAPSESRRMTAKEYAAYLRSDHWKHVCDEWREVGNLQRCFVCNKAQYELHHCTYEHLGCESLSDLIPLCREHHTWTHRLVKQEGKPLAKAHLYVKSRYNEGRLEMKEYRVEKTK